MTTYNASIGYDTNIPYNGAVEPVVVSHTGAGYAYVPRKLPDDEEAIVAMLLELLDD